MTQIILSFPTDEAEILELAAEMGCDPFPYFRAVAPNYFDAWAEKICIAAARVIYREDATHAIAEANRWADPRLPLLQQDDHVETFRRSYARPRLTKTATLLGSPLSPNIMAPARH